MAVSRGGGGGWGLLPGKYDPINNSRQDIMCKCMEIRRSHFSHPLYMYVPDWPPLSGIFSTANCEAIGLLGNSFSNDIGLFPVVFCVKSWIFFFFCHEHIIWCPPCRFIQFYPICGTGTNSVVVSVISFIVSVVSHAFNPERAFWNN